MEKINFYFPTTWLQNVDYRFRLCWCYHQQNPFKRESEGDESIKINANGSTAPENFISNQDLEVANGCMPGATLAHNPQMADKLNDLKKLTDKVTDGGNLIFSSCITGVGEPGKLFGENLWQFTGERLNIFNAKDFINPGWLQENARLSFQNNGYGVPVVKQENSYYGFGLIMPNSPVAMPALPNKQLYNGGSEWQNDYSNSSSNLPDYYQTFNRNYDAALGRFVGVDPEAESAESMTSYQYAGNNPIMMNDPMGNSPKVLNGGQRTGYNPSLGHHRGRGDDYDDQDEDEYGVTWDDTDYSYEGFWDAFTTDINNYLASAGPDVNIQFTGATVGRLYGLFEQDNDETTVFNGYLDAGDYDRVPSSGNGSNTATAAISNKGGPPNYIQNVSYNPDVPLGVQVVEGFNDPGDLGVSAFAWVQQVSKYNLDSGDDDTFIDLGSGPMGSENWPFYYPDYYLDERTNAIYDNQFYTLRYGDQPYMQENGLWEGVLTLIGQNADFTISAIQSVYYNFSNINGYISPSGPPVSVPTPQFTQDQIDQYNQGVNGPPWL